MAGLDKSLAKLSPTRFVLASEQASEKDELADQMPGVSTYPGTPTSGGWVPVLLKAQSHSRPIVIDWICPMCKRLTGHSRVCPKCGLSIKETPRRKMRPIPRSMKINRYRKWANEIFG